MTLSKHISKMVNNYHYEDFPNETIDRTKYLALDYIGLAARGNQFESSKPIHQMVKENGGSGTGTVIGKKGIKPSYHYAALANGSSAHSLELDDVINSASLHPAVVIFPTAFSLAEKDGKSGKDLITSSVMGYEIMGRLGEALNPSNIYSSGFHPTGVCGIFGAVATASKMMKLSEDQTMNAFGIAGSQAAASMEFLEDGSWTKRLHPGWASYSGLIASELAKHSFLGPSTSIEGKNGFANSYSYDYNLDVLRKEFSLTNNAIMNTSIKPHACCRYKQGSLDLILKIVKENDLKPEEINKINIYLVETAIPIICEPTEHKRNPKTTVDAQFSMYFGASVAAVYRKTLLEEYETDVVERPEVKEMMQKVYCHHDPDLEKDFPKKWPAKVVIESQKGTFSESIEYPKGDPENPLTWEELIEKFKYVSQPVFSEQQQEEIINHVRNLENIKDIRELTKLL